MATKTTPALLALTLLSLTGITTALRHPSYHERLLASAQMLDRARARARAAAGAGAGAGAGARAESAPGASPSSEHAHDLLWTGSKDPATGDEESLLRRLLDMDPKQLREAALQSLRALAAEGRSSSNNNGRNTGRGEESGQKAAKKETPADFQRCMNDTADTLVALAERRRWALLMVDAMGKPSPAVSEGNFLWPGAYDMCNGIRANISSPHKSFSGKYCNAYVLLSPQSATLTGGGVFALGLCVPDTCSEFDMSYLLTDLAYRLGIKYQIGVQCPPSERPLDTRAIVAIVLCSLLLLCMVLGTAADVLLRMQDRRRQEKADLVQASNGWGDDVDRRPLLTKGPPLPPRQPGILLKILIAFSVYTNGSKLMSLRQPEGSLTCVHGVRFLSMTWVVLGHVFLFPASLADNAGPYVQKAINRWTFQGISNALVSVDSFFVLSGLLVSYLTLKELRHKNGRLNWFLFYFHRFWRLTPAYMLVIMVYLCLSPYWGSGPFWPVSQPDRDVCKDHWWVNLLYVNNFVYPSQMCLGQSWYLANDMQFFCVLSPLVILPLYYSRVAGLLVATVLVLVHCVTNAALTMHYNFPPGMFAHIKGNVSTDMQDWEPVLYMKPYTRWGPYVIGMLAGYFLYDTRCKLNIKWHVNSLLWGMATAAALAVLYGLYGASTGDPMTLGLSAFYNAMHRNVWAVCLCWVIVACVTGNGGFVNTVLSWPGFVPLSRLTYCIYLVHIMVIMIYLDNSGAPFYYSDLNVVMLFLSVLVASYMAAAVASLAFEAPMMALEKVIFSRDRSRDSNQQQAEEQQQQQQNGVSVNK